MADSEGTLTPGLLEFYGSQASVILAQYRNIEELLGNTSDYSGPGIHCEVLLRDFLRKNLPEGIRADKGFIAGRYGSGKHSRHCPEIDILVHDALRYRPIFRLEDFVIVQRESVLGVIQVKRNLSTKECREGIQNVMKAKRHLLDMELHKYDTDMTRGHIVGESRDPVVFMIPVFSAVIGFTHNPTKSDTLKQRLNEAYSEPTFGMPHYTHGQTQMMMPDFVGALQSVFALSDLRTSDRKYRTFRSRHKEQNIALQALLSTLSGRVWEIVPHLRGARMPPFDFHNPAHLDEFSIPK